MIKLILLLTMLNANAFDIFKNVKTEFCKSDRFNCGDFGSCTDVKKVYIQCFKEGVGDIHRLDGDSDGIPCESVCNKYSMESD